MKLESWGRFPRVSHLGVYTPVRPSEAENAIKTATATILPRGLGRSYGDSCLNENGYLLATKWLDKFLAFDARTGVLRCEAGTTLDEILRVLVPRGWFLPVTPGTKFVTLGGAIANDIHGKNHHRAGCFGNHVLRFELLRSDGARMVCSREANADWFHATIGGLGLTGMILWAEVQMKLIPGPYIAMESIRFKNLEEFFAISKASERDYEYTVSWLDCSSTGAAMGRGIFMRGNHSEEPERDVAKALHPSASWKTVPVEAPAFLLSPLTIKAFNFLFYHKQLRRSCKTRVHYDPFFYPLDGINNWNLLYGKRGFLQWQCVVPATPDNAVIKALLQRIAASKRGSFLVVLKEFGAMPPEGMLSFPRPGITLALDFANAGEPLMALLDELDDVVISAGGRIYPAKDARMSAKTFHASFPAFGDFAKYVDPKFSSSFYRRVRSCNGE